MTLMLLADSAIRSLMLGAAVWVSLKLVRLRDGRSETLIWTMVLAASLFMPLLLRWLPGIALPLPSLFNLPAAPAIAAQAPAAALSAPAPAAAAWSWPQAHAAVLLWSVYILPAAVILARLMTGLLLTARLYARATPIAAGWAAGRPIRTSAAISGPISFGRCILLPADYRQWSSVKLRAVLAHEQCHVRRGDFFTLLLAALHRALFWFSPFAWWLQARLSALAELESDDAAVRALDDRAGYAEILIDISRRTRERVAPDFEGQIAMARGPNIHWRVERILDDKAQSRLPLVVRLLSAGAIVPAAFVAAAAHGAVPPQPSSTLPHLLVVRPVPQAIPLAVAAGEPRTKPTSLAPRSHGPMAAAAHARSQTHAATPADEVGYNPRALLDDPAAAILPALVATSGGSGGKKKNSGNAGILLNLNGIAGD